ncbi:hypothetical protein, conserved [Eimeria tenella]|uniref:Coiled-coil domain-containing protein 47 n=1 Tax=Eimeria tenella TaxID=5802 RepID=U6KI22_EIMTE|nr:hypothetical protein, conserved [Eimeria tenella]CDJ37685.1 hypothetical protein, conserved [Eimeria tenella]|eukprot:XP_013228523.1 hypothetical protein, conserved [Eimeria tenella]
MKKYFGGGLLLLLAAAVQQLLLLPARAAEGPAVLGAPAKSSPGAITSRAPQHEAPGGFSDLSVTIEDDDDSEFEEASEELPIPSAFGRRPAAAPAVTVPARPSTAAADGLPVFAIGTAEAALGGAANSAAGATATAGAAAADAAAAAAVAAAASKTPRDGWTFMLYIWRILTRYYLVDISAAVLLVMVIWTAVKGKATNTRVAIKWMQEVREVLSIQFADVSKETKGSFAARSYDCFELFCSGRRNCLFMEVTLNCVPRQDLWRGWLLNGLVGRENDEITLECLLPNGGEGMIVGFCKKEDQRSFLEAHWDVTEFCKVRLASHMSALIPEGFSLVSDTLEAAEKLFDFSGASKLMQQLGPRLKCLYTSDLCTNTNPALTATIAAICGTAAAGAKKPKRVLRMSYYLEDGDSEFDQRLPVVLACKLVDMLATIRLSDANREAVRRMRLSYEKEQHKNRRKEQEEEAERRRQDKKKEQQKALERLPPEERKKAEEAQEARERKKSQRQGVKVREQFHEETASQESA